MSTSQESHPMTTRSTPHDLQRANMFRRWRNANRDELIVKFVEEFGSRIEEWPDFVEGEFEAHLRATQP